MNVKNHTIVITKLFALLIFLAGLPSGAEAQTDSLYMRLDSTTVVSKRHTSAFRQTSQGLMKVDLSLIQSMPKILGNTDPLHFVRLLPGVQTNSEYNSGIHIHGCDASHNEMSIAGVPLFGVNHLLGLFSVFNPEHYKEMTFSHTAGSNRLGGMLRMELPDTLQKKVSGSVSLGIMSSQGTVGVRIGEKSHLRVSARQSYMNLLYGRWLKLNDSQIKYGFGDYNLTWLWNSGKGDKVWVDGYFGMDSAGLDERSYDIGMSLRWGNYIGAVHWEHKGRFVRHNHTLYSSGYKCECLISHSTAAAEMPSFINVSGYKGKIGWDGLDIGAELAYYHVMPQVPQIEGLFNSTEAQRVVQDALEGTLSVKYEKTVAYDWNLAAGLKGVLYLSPETKLNGGLTPEVSVSYNGRRFGKVGLSYGWQQQYVFQTGLSNVGFPIEFWFMAGKLNLPQYSQNAMVSYDLNFARNMYAFSLDLYYRQLYNQVEYDGDLFDLFLSKYDLTDNLLKGRGWNYGLNVMLQKQSGKFTGWLSYALGRSLRRFNNPGYAGIYPANHERIHEFNAVASYKYRRWDFAGTFICASGQPFTAPGSYYISSGKLIVNYGEHNACRMRPYIRMDVSVSCAIKKDDRQENGINISVYNVLARKNDAFYALNITDDNRFAYVPRSFMLRIMPSISYYHKF